MLGVDASKLRAPWVAHELPDQHEYTWRPVSSYTDSQYGRAIGTLGVNVNRVVGSLADAYGESTVSVVKPVHPALATVTETGERTSLVGGPVAGGFWETYAVYVRDSSFGVEASKLRVPAVAHELPYQHEYTCRPVSSYTVNQYGDAIGTLGVSVNRVVGLLASTSTRSAWSVKVPVHPRLTTDTLEVPRTSTVGGPGLGAS